jgi:hypothetical protein
MTLSPSQNRITKKLPFLSPIRAPSELWSTPGTFTRPPANTNTTLITRRIEAPTSKSCTQTAINKTSRSMIHESFRDYRYSCADAKSASSQ